MPVFYALHEIFNVLEVNTDDKGNVDHGKRNSKLFLLGTFIWIVIFVLLWNLKMGYFGPVKLWVDSLVYGLFVVLIADLMVMAYTYKSYFGRNILYEVNEEDTEKFDYDQKKHKYNRKKEFVEESVKENSKESVKENSKESVKENSKEVEN